MPASLAAYRVSIAGSPYLPSWAVTQQIKGEERLDKETLVWHLRAAAHTLTAAPQMSTVLVDGVPEKLFQPPLLKEGELLLPEAVWSRWIYRWRIPAAPRRGVSALRTIVVDAGHGGYDPGTTSRSGFREKSVTLDVALRLRDLLQASGFRVVMTRTSDRFISLSRRSDIANSEQGDLFVSIHANSSRSRAASGFEVYYLSEATDDHARALEASENVSLPEEVGHSISQETQAIVWDLLYTEHRAESVEMARSICRGLKQGGVSQNRGVKSARFAVLKGSRMPAILVEVGFLSHPAEAERLRQPSYRQKIAEGIRNGVLQFKAAQEQRA